MPQHISFDHVSFLLLLCSRLMYHVNVGARLGLCYSLVLLFDSL